MDQLLAARDELYIQHVERCINWYYKIRYRIFRSLKRIFDLSEENIENGIKLMVICHDVGKLTRKWQHAIKEGYSAPPHSVISAAYIYHFVEEAEFVLADSIINSVLLAVLIHHIDSGEARDSLEAPDQIVTSHFKEIEWSYGAESLLEDINKKFLYVYKPIRLPNRQQILRYLSSNIRWQLRPWCRSINPIERHYARLLASAFHHVLKICDWRAAHERKNIKDIRGTLKIVLCEGLLP